MKRGLNLKSTTIDQQIDLLRTNLSHFKHMAYLSKPFESSIYQLEGQNWKQVLIDLNAQIIIYADIIWCV